MKIDLSRKNKTLLILVSISVVVLAVLFLLMNLAPFGVRALRTQTGKSILDYKFYYSSETVYEYFSGFGESDLKNLTAIRIIDVFVGIFVAVLQICLIILLSQKDYKVLLVMPFSLLELLFDGSENLFLSLIQSKLPEQRETLASMCGGVTMSKWIFFILTALSLIVFAVLVFVKKNATTRGVEEATDKGEETTVEKVDE